MPTIDELAPATAAADTDALVASQNGVARKVTRAQLVSGLQPQLSVSTGVLLGRISVGAGNPEQVNLGSNLVLNGSTLSASPFEIAQLPAGVVPGANDLISIAQGGTDVAVSYAQLANGLGAVGGIDASSMTVSVAGTTETLSAFAAAAVLKSGGSLTGPLTLAADPAAALQPATKQYVDARVTTALPLSGGVIAGTLSVTGAAQLASVTVEGNLGVSGGLVGSTLSVTGGVSVGGSIATIGPLFVQGGVTITGGLLTVPQYSIAALPAASPGALAYATNGRKPGEAIGAGSGVLVWGAAGNQWLSAFNGMQVQA